MATQYHNGTNTMAASAWSGLGFTNGDVLVVAKGAEAITEAMDQTGATTTGIERLAVVGNFTGSIGTPGSPLLCEFDDSPSGRPGLLMDANATVHIRPETLTLPEIWVQRGNLHVYGAQELSRIYLLGGNLYLYGTVDPDQIFHLGGKLYQEETTVVQTTTYEMLGGYSELKVAPATLNLAGGRMKCQSETANFTAATLRGGRLDHFAGNIPTLVAYPAAVLDARNLIKEVAIGSSAYTRVGNFDILGRSNKLLAVSNETAIATGDAAPGIG